MPRHYFHAIHKILLAFAIGSYLLSFVCIDGKEGRVFGLSLFFLGALSLFDLCPVWLANPTLWIGLIFLINGRRWKAFLAGPLALTFGLSYLFWEAWSAGQGQKWGALRIWLRDGAFPPTQWEHVWRQVS